MTHYYVFKEINHNTLYQFVPVKENSLYQMDGFIQPVSCEDRVILV